MKPPLYVRPLTAGERRALEAGLRASEAFTLRRRQILLASAAGRRASEIARAPRLDPGTALNAIRAFNARGLGALRRRSSRPKTVHFALPPTRTEALAALLHQSPRAFGQAAGRWSLARLAAVAAAQGLGTRRLTPEGRRQALRRAGVRRRRAKAWTRSPDPAYARKKGPGTDCSDSPPRTPTGSSASGTRAGGAG